MKFLVLALVLGIAWVIWRNGRARPDASDAMPPPNAPGGAASPMQMLQCAHCGTHVPANEAQRGHKGVYCGRAHLLVAEPEHGA